MPVHESPALEEKRLDLVRKGLLDRELDDDPYPDVTPTFDKVINDLKEKLESIGLTDEERAEVERIEREPRVPYSKPKPGMRKRKKVRR